MRGSYLNDPCQELRTGEPDDGYEPSEAERAYQSEGKLLWRFDRMHAALSKMALVASECIDAQGGDGSTAVTNAGDIYKWASEALSSPQADTTRGTR